jgi:Glycosyl hydrolases family 16.
VHPLLDSFTLRLYKLQYGFQVLLPVGYSRPGCDCCCTDYHQLQPYEEYVLSYLIRRSAQGERGLLTNTSFPETCPADTGLNKYRLNTDFTSGSLGRWNTTAGTVTTTDLGAKFTVSEQGDAPTIESEFYIFFGHVDVKMRAANGTGIVSTWILESDDLDEIDWVSSPAAKATNLQPPKKRTH